MDSEPRVERPKAAGTSGQHSGRRATRMNGADAPVKQTAHSGRRSAERRHPVRGSEPTVPRSRPRTPNGALRVLRVQSREWSGRRPRERAASKAGEARRGQIGRMNSSDKPLKETAHSGRRSAERRHPVRGSESMVPRSRPGTPNGALRVLRVQSREWSGRRPRERAASIAGKVPRGSIGQMHRSDRPLKQTAHSGRRSAERRHPGARLRTNGAPARGSEPMAPRRAALNQWRPGARL